MGGFSLGKRDIILAQFSNIILCNMLVFFVSLTAEMTQDMPMLWPTDPSFYP